MATARGGDITQVLIKGREFGVKADSNVTYRLSGWTNESTPNGNGDIHTESRRKLGGFDGIPLSLNPDNSDLEYLQEIANEKEPVPMSMTLVGGQTYSGDLTIQGEVDGTSGDGQVEITALGKKFEQI